MTQTSLKTPFKDLPPFKDPTPFKDPAPFQGAMKRSYRERLEDAPIKKRVMAEIHLKRRGLDALPRPPKVKQEQGEEPYPDSDLDVEGRAELQVVGGMAKALDLSPGLKHTLAQFTLSSQSSLGGPAAFSARTGREPSPADLPPPTSPPVLGGGPLLVPCDSSTELSHSLLEGESISCFLVGGEKRLCLPQVLNSVLRDFSLQQINAVCDELYVYCSRCDGEQLHILKVLGILPFNAPSCGLITLTDAQRLCNALLRPGAALPADPGGKQTAGAGLLEEGGAGGGFQVEHRCLGKGQGLFVARFYGGPDAPCIQCLECRLLFSPQKFVMHSHRSPDKRTCHWGFDSAKWPRYLQLARKYQGGPREAELQQRLAELKEKFHCQTKRTPDREEESQLRKPSLDDKLADGDAPRKGGSSPGSLVLNRLFPDIKEEPGRPPLVQPSYFLYTYDKTVAPNVSLRRDAEVSPEVLGLLLRHQNLPNNQNQQTEAEQEEPPMDLHASPHRERRIPAVSKEMSSPSRRKAAHAPACRPPPPPSSLLSAGTEAAEDLSAEGAGLEDDKDRIVVEIMQMYSRQQEKLNSTLQKQLQLEMELEAVRGGEAARLLELSVEQKELRSELEAVHSEQVRQLSHARLEQLQLETRLETLRQQACACQPGTPRQQEAIYTAQLAELSQRLERAEAERQELQAELRAERAAREKLERTIAQLKQQMGGSSSPSASPSPSPITASTDTNSPPCPAPEAGPTALE